jgi:hypothetical protein
MSFKVSKITVGKGRTVSDEKQGTWIRQYYEAEVTISDESQIELAKNSVEALLDMWLRGESLVQPEKWTYDMSKIRWEQAHGSSGPYERSEDVNSRDFKALLKDVQAHGGKMTIGDYFVWAFKNGATLGRKKRK